MRLSALSSYVCSSDLFVDQPPRNLTPGHSAVSGDDFADVVEHHQIAVASSVDAKVRAARQQRDDMLFLFVIAGRFKLQLELLRSEEHTSELQSLMRISYAVFCLKKKNKTITPITYECCSLNRK